MDVLVVDVDVDVDGMVVSDLFIVSRFSENPPLSRSKGRKRSRRRVWDAFVQSRRQRVMGLRGRETQTR
jgi:hypothetical protein